MLAMGLGSQAPRDTVVESIGCAATLDSPHPSRGLIKAHMRIKCRRPVLGGHVENQLWRLRWWGWEAVGEAGNFTNSKPGKYFDTHAEWQPDEGCYYYRNTGSGWIISNDGVQIPTPGAGVNYDQRWKKGLPPGCGTHWTAR